MNLREHLRRYTRLMTEPLPPDPKDRRDPEFIRGELEVLGAFTDAWFAPDVMGLEHAPPGRALVVGTHNGGNLAPDMFSLMVAIWRRRSPDYPSYGLAHDQVMKAPWLGRWLGKLGAVPARQDNARELLERDVNVLVYPGGDLDAFKPHSERHVVKFGGRSGFVRTALRARAPIVPVVSVGAHDTFRVLTDGRDAARVLGFKRLARLEVLPLFLCLPWGLWIGPWELHLPAPSKLRIRMLPAMHFNLPPEAADDQQTVLRVREEVRATMQAALDQLVIEGGFGIGMRLSEVAHR